MSAISRKREPRDELEDRRHHPSSDPRPMAFAEGHLFLRAALPFCTIPANATALPWGSDIAAGFLRRALLIRLNTYHTDMALPGDPDWSPRSAVGHLYAADILQIALDSAASFYPGCTQIIQSCTFELRLPPRSDSDPTEDLSWSHLRMFQDCMRFLTTPRTPEQLHDLAQQLAQCRCSSGPMAPHRWTERFRYLHDDFQVSPHPKRGAPTNHSNLLDAVKALARIILARIQTATKARGKLYKVERNRRRDERHGRPSIFPVTPDDIFPFGARASMNSLFNWYEWCSHEPHGGSDAIPELIADIIARFGSFVFPAVVFSETLLDTIHFVVLLRSKQLRVTKPENPPFYDLQAASRILGVLALSMPPLLVAKWCFRSSDYASNTMEMEVALVVLVRETAGPIVTASGEVIMLGPIVDNFNVFHRRLTVGM
jgi:hypothetical protein